MWDEEKTSQDVVDDIASAIETVKNSVPICFKEHGDIPIRREIEVEEDTGYHHITTVFPGGCEHYLGVTRDGYEKLMAEAK